MNCSDNNVVTTTCGCNTGSRGGNGFLLIIILYILLAIILGGAFGSYNY